MCRITLACCRRSLAGVAALLAGGANPNSMVPCSIGGRTLANWTALHEAAWQGHSRVVEVLLAAGADPTAVDCYGSMPLNRAIYAGHLAVVRLLLQAAPEVRGLRWFVLCCAVLCCRNLCWHMLCCAGLQRRHAAAG